MIGGDIIIFKTENNKQAEKEFRKKFPQYSIKWIGKELKVEIDNGDKFLPILVKAISPHITSMQLRRPTLEDVFLEITGRKIREENNGKIEDENKDFDITSLFSLFNFSETEEKIIYQLISRKAMNKKLQTLYIIWYREVLIYLRNSLKFFTSIFLPILILIFLGTGLKTIFPTPVLHYDFAQFFFPGILGLSISVMAISSTMSIVWDREFGFLKEILVSPISRSYIALGKILGATTTALLQGSLILLTTPYLGINFSILLFLK